MKKMIRSSPYLFAMAIFCVAPTAIAQNCSDPNTPGSNCMELTSAGNLDSLGPAYVGPYVATIAGSTNVDVICDDFTTESYLDTPWLYTTETLANLSGAKFYSSTNSAADTAGYEEVAWLSEQLQSNPTGACALLTTSNCQADIQYAIWSIFDPGTGGALSYISGNDLSTAEALVTDASGHLNDNFSNVTIYTASPKGESQEFIVVNMPEPPALWLLGVDLCGVIGGVFFFIRRGRKAVS